MDIEAAIAREDLSCVAAHFFAPDECAALVRCAADACTMRFHGIWTRKEACVPALGAGLVQPLQSFSVPAPDGYAAAVVVEGAGARLSCRRWPGVSRAA